MVKIINYGLIIVAIVISMIFYFTFDLEMILWSKHNNSINSDEIQKNPLTDYTGKQVEDDTFLVETQEEWQQVLNDIDYVTVIPKSIVKTDVYSLAKWVGYYTKKANGTSGRRLTEVKKTSLDISTKYVPYYIIELTDGSHILAQMNRGLAKRIQKGEKIKLPLGKKIGFLKTAKALLQPICDENNVKTDYVLYTIDNKWQADNQDKIFVFKLVISFGLFIFIAVIMQLLFEKLLKKKLVK